MKGKVLIGLSKDDDETPVFLPFNINSEKLPDKIAEFFDRSRPPEFLYDVTDNLESRNIRVFPENTELSEGRQYLWVEAKDHWQDKKLVQNALFCSNAAYQKNPLEYLNDKKRYHGVTQLIAANVKFGKQVASLFIASNDFTSQTKKLLIVAFRGTTTKKDIESDLQIGLKTDETFVGEVHGGFLERMKSVPVEEILNLASRLQVDFVVTCGHSLGGAVSTLVNIKLKKELEVRNWSTPFSNNLINITFGAPLIGNYAFAQYLTEKNYSKNIYNFVSERDVVPALLFIGYGLQRLKEKSTGFLMSVLRTALFNYPTSCYQLLLKSLNFDVDPEKVKTAVNALKAEKSTFHEVYQELNYAPVGKYLLIQKTLNQIQPLNNDPKIVEGILQKTINFTCENPSEITKCHSIESYFDLINRSHRGFVNFKKPTRTIFIEKKYSKNFIGQDGLSYRSENVCSFNCGYKMCLHASKSVYKKEQPVSFCLICKDNPPVTEHFYHGKYCSVVHKQKAHRLSLRELTWNRFEDRPKEFELIFADPKYVYLMKSLHQFVCKVIRSLELILVLMIFVMAVVLLLDCFWIISGHVDLICVVEFLFSKLWKEEEITTVILTPFLGFFVFAVIDYFLRRLKFSLSRATEDELKASVIVDALQLLEVPLPSTKFEYIHEEDVMECFRRKALLFHPGRQIELSKNATKRETRSHEREKEENKEAIDAIDFSRNILVSYCRNPTILSNSVVKNVQIKLEHVLFELPIPLSIQLGKGMYPPEKTEIRPINVKIKTLKKRKAKSIQTYTTEKKT